jgi:RNA polymerase sigma-70 factor, ECF subfamily
MAFMADRSIDARIRYGRLVDTTVATEELELVARLRDGDEQAFVALVEEHSPAMLAVARAHVRTHAVAEEVVQEAWVGVLKGIHRFEGRSSLRTWILRIVVNTAITRGIKEARSTPFSSLAQDDEPAVEPERFRSGDDPFPGHWHRYPADWSSLPEQTLESRETLAVVKEAIGELPEPQRLVITMRDVAGLDAEEVCSALGVSEGNQRVLLHRARARVRSRLEAHLDAA